MASAEIEVHAQAGLAHAAALVAHLLRGARGDVARREVAERRIHPLEVVVAVLLGDVVRVLPAVLLLLRHPDAAVVAERLRHERQLRLVVAGDRDAGRVDLREAGVGEAGAALVGAPDGGGVGVARVGGEIEDVAVAAGGEHDGVGRVAGDLAGDEVADDDALGVAVDHDEVEHLGVREHLHAAEADHARERGIGAEQELLAGLAAGVERARHLRAAEGAVGEQAAVFAGEGHALRHALVDDVDRHLGEPVDVGLAGAEIAALDRVVEEPVDAVAVVLVVLGGVDAALGGDGVGAARAVVKDEALHPVAELGQRGGGRGAGEAGADDDDLVLPLVRRVDELDLRLVLGPLLRERARGNSWIRVWPWREKVSAGRRWRRRRRTSSLGGVGAGGGLQRAGQDGAGDREAAEEVEHAIERRRSS